ncbi:MAG: prepilin-type N-terminal cleavage/methylation domain-containing protein [Pirellulales bacterium]|nr:prepilin-type N-terminal cleavage/methylation domain-containing protein [Pirellulales bacterium]
MKTVGSRQRAAGSGQRAVGSGQQAAGSGQQAAGSEWGLGIRDWGLAMGAKFRFAANRRVFRGENARRGVSLLEVLIAMFVVTLGLLGVVSLIPTGHFAVVESTKSDRAAACGRAAMSEVKVRRMLDSSLWRCPNGTSGAVAAQYGDAFIIDPLFVANNLPEVPGNEMNLAAFPCDGSYPPAYTPFFLNRVTLPMSASVADRVFTWGDDLLFKVDRGDAEQRTRASYFWADDGSTQTGTAPYPVLPTDTQLPTASGDYQRLLQQDAKHYSWMLTVAPAPSENVLPVGGVFNFRKYRVSTVVSYRRDLGYRPLDPGNPPSVDDMPTERLVNVRLDGGGYGGGDVTIHIPDNCMGSAGADQYEAYLKVRPGQWIMLMGLKLDARVPPRPDVSNWQARRVAQWYQVVAADDVQHDSTANAYGRRLTLAGPDWDPTVIGDVSGTPGAKAVLVDGVIGVYTKTIELDTAAAWNP